MTKGQKGLFILLELIAFISPFFLFAFDSALSFLCILPVLVLLVWSLRIIRERTALAVSGLIVTALTVILVLAVALPGFLSYREKQKQYSTDQQQSMGQQPK